MSLYAESSAVLSWLLGEPGGEQMGDLLGHSDFVIASQLTLVECDRAIERGLHLNRITMNQANERRALLKHAAEPWFVLHVSDEIAERARQPFPIEPIRILDALHLASLLDASALVPGVSLLSLDKRVRECGHAFGFEVLPNESE